MEEAELRAALELYGTGGIYGPERAEGLIDRLVAAYRKQRNALAELGIELVEE